MRERSLLFLLFLLVSSITHGQLSDLAKIDYTRLPKGSSDVGYDRLRALVNYPIKVNDGAYFLVGLDYSKIDLSFGQNVTDFDKDAIDDFQLLDINIGYTYKMNAN